MKQACSLVAVAVAVVALGMAPSGADASAKNSPRMPVRIHATIEKLDKNLLTVKTDKGGVLTLEMTPKTDISGVATRGIADIRPQDFIGVTATEDGQQHFHATEVHIYPDAMRGAGEGHYGGTRKSTINAAVAAVADSADGRLLTLSFQNKATGMTESAKVDVSRNVPVLAYVPADQRLLKPGADAIMLVAKADDGDLIAVAVVAEKDGVKPPL
jgi:hypothetical protein